MSDKKALIIKWQRLLSDGQTCPRCGSTEAAVEKAVAALTPALALLGIAVVLEKNALSAEAFRRDPLQSNMIWLNGRLLEDWLEAQTGRSECCDVCGPNDCRTVGVGGEIYEAIPAELIVRAGLLAAAALLGTATTGPSPGESRAKQRCCPE